jgi:ABC-2 type transport system permease protein
MITIFKKDLLLFLKDKRALLLTFLLPIILISLFAFAFGGMGGKSSKPRAIQFLVTDLDNTSYTKQIISKLDSVKEIEIHNTTLDSAKSQVNKGNDAGVLVFYSGFGDSIKNGKSLPVELFYDKAQEMQVGLLRSMLIGAFQKLESQHNLQSKMAGFLSASYPSMDKKAIEKMVSNNTDIFQKSGNHKSSGMELKMTSMVGESKDSNLFLIQAIAGVAVMMLLFSISGLAAGMLDEKESGTLKRLLHSPLNPNAILFGKMLTAMVVSVAQLLIMFTFAWAAFGLDISKNIPALTIMILTTAFAVSGIGIFLASVAKTRAQAQGMGTLVVLTMSAIGGSMVPLFVMPAIMQKIAVFSVNYWGIQGFYDIFWRGMSTLEILPRGLVLLGIGLLLILLSTWLFKKNIEKLS